MTRLPLTSIRSPFGGPQVVGYGYAWRVAADGALESTRTENGRRVVVRRLAVGPHQPSLVE